MRMMRTSAPSKRSSSRKKTPPGKSRLLPASGQNEAVLKVNGREVPVSRLDKVFYPAAGFTKGQVLDYYIRISSVLLPHLKDRPFTLKRYPDGVNGGFF